MWVSAFFGMATIYAEITVLANLSHHRRGRGHRRRRTTSACSQGFAGEVLAGVFSVPYSGAGLHGSIILIQLRR